MADRRSGATVISSISVSATAGQQSNLFLRACFCPIRQTATACSRVVYAVPMRPDIWASGRRIRQAGEGGTVPNLLALFGVKRPWIAVLDGARQSANDNGVGYAPRPFDWKRAGRNTRSLGKLRLKSADATVANTVAIFPKVKKNEVKSIRLTRHPFRHLLVQ